MHSSECIFFLLRFCAGLLFTKTNLCKFQCCAGSIRHSSRCATFLPEEGFINCREDFFGGMLLYRVAFWDYTK